MRYPTTFVLALLLPCAAVRAQHEPDRRAKADLGQGVFTLPAGRHGAAELVDLLAQVRGGKIHCAREELDLSGADPVVLSRELRLDREAFEDVVTTLLRYQALLLVPAEQAGEQRVVAMHEALPPRELGVVRTPEQILARPTRVEWVRTVVPSGAVLAPQRMLMLRGLLAAVAAPWPMQMRLVQGDLELTGSSEEVAFALRIMQLQDHTTPAAQPPFGWRSATALDWPGGRMSLAKFLDLLSDRLDANVLGEVDDATVDLGPPAQLHAADWLARAMAMLRPCDLLLVPADTQNRLFLLRSAQVASGRDVKSRTFFESPEDIAKSALIGPVMTVVDLHHIDASTAIGKVRAKLGGSLVIGVLSSTSVLVGGLRDEVAGMLELLRSADS